jgi:hypothetical protein
VKLSIASGSRFGQTQVLSGTRMAWLGGLAAGPAEKLAVSWTEETGEMIERSVPFARVGSAEQGFSPADLIGHRSGGSWICDASDATIAFDPVSDQPVAAWVERIDAGLIILSAIRR